MVSWWLWVMEKKLGMLEMVLEEGRRRKWHFSKATRKAKSETLAIIDESNLAAVTLYERWE